MSAAEPAPAPAARERIVLYDTTLRDGAQTPGVDFSLADKAAVRALLDRLGVDYCEGGYPGANPGDTAFFAAPPPGRARLAAFGMTKRVGASASNDPGLAALLEARADAVCFVAKASAFHVEVALGATREENLASIRESVEAVVRAGREAIVDLEHFFDGLAHDREHALDCARAAHEAGASWLVLCDTNGGSLPATVREGVAAVRRALPEAALGIHAHDDCGHAVANSLAAVEAGARQVQGTLNGIGERCGNADLVTLIGVLAAKEPYASRFETGVDARALEGLTAVSRAFDELINRQPDRQAPFVGASAFATKAGIHASALLKDPRTYEHAEPARFGNARALLVSTQGGRSNVLAELERLGVDVARDDSRIARLLEEVKRREALGYSYEGADASFFLLAQRALGRVPSFFEVERFKVNVERRFNAAGDLVTVSEAIVKVRIDGETLISAAEGEGPVNALDRALRKDLGKYQERIAPLRLTDFKVRIFAGGTDAVTRVLIESGDGTTERWTTVGVSANIIDASFQALTDSIVYRLLRTEPG